VYISCAASYCPEYGKIVSQDAATVGWTYTSIPTDGSVPQQQAAIETAIREKANEVIMVNAVKSTLTTQLADLQRAHIAFITAGTADTPGGGFTWANAQASALAQGAAWNAAYIAVDSDLAPSTSVLFVNIPFVPVFAGMGSAFKSDLLSYCAACGYSSMDIGANQLANAPQLIVAYLRAHPKINYVMLSIEELVGSGLPAALSAAGLSKVKVVGYGSSPQILQYLQSGQFATTVLVDYYSTADLMFDAAVRYAAGVPQQFTGNLAQWFVTDKTVSTVPTSKDGYFPVISDSQAQFAKLWGK
jgi:ABC-type sugar transport system substrate-binding protein